MECHQRLSNEEVLKQLNVIKPEHYPLFNQTSVNHLYIAASGFNGPDAQQKAIEILRKIELETTKIE